MKRVDTIRPRSRAVRLHVRGLGLPDETAIQLWIVDGRISTEPVAGADTVFDGGWILPGLVDAHCHVGLGKHGNVELDEAIAQAETERDVGALLLRDCGSPTDTRGLDDHEDLPRIIRAGRHLARPKRYIAGFAVELEDESQLPAAVAEQARRGDGWVKLVGDWIDRQIGDLAPLWSDDVLKAAIDTAHAQGARVTAHVFSEDALPGDQRRHRLHRARHRPHRRHHRLDARARHRVGPHADQPGKLSGHCRCGRALSNLCRAHARPVCPRLWAGRCGAGGGVPVYAGTDAGSTIEHGRIADEVAALQRIGMTAHEALGAACWDARRWLGRPGLDDRASADLLCYAQDPRQGPVCCIPIW